MKHSSNEPFRLLDLRPQDDPANLASLVRSATRAPADPVPRVKGRVRSSLRRKSARRQRTLKAALLGGLILLGGGVMAGAMPSLRFWEKPKSDPSPSRAGVPQPPRARQHRHPAPPQAENVTSLASTEIPESPKPPQGLAAVEPAPVEPTPRFKPPAPLARETMPSKDARPRTPLAQSTVQDEQPENPSLRGASGAPVRTAMLAPQPLAPQRHPSLAASALEPVSKPPDRALAREEPRPERREEAEYSTYSNDERRSGHGPQPPGRRGGVLKLALEPAPSSPALSAPSPKPTGSTPPTEQSLLEKAIRSLRSEHRPANALAALDEYMARFPSGNLLPEATRLRTEALLALGHKPDALAELNREPMAGGAGHPESRLVRGELHAAAGRWQEALRDFDLVLRSFTAHPVAEISAKQSERFERALWGRASARSHLGDEAGARADLSECLRRFPQGRMASQAAHLLGGQR